MRPPPQSETHATRAPLRRWEALVLVPLVAAYLGVLVARAWRVGVTVDEPAHLLSSHLYWRGADNLKPRDLPPLIKIVGGWVPGRLGLPVPYDHPAWRMHHEWIIAIEMMDRMNADQIRAVFFYSRLPLLIFPLLTVVLLWWWARQVFSPVAGVLLAAAFMLSPTALGHGAFFKNDLAATFGYLLFWWRAWAFWRDPRPRNVAWMSAAASVALLAKLSMMILLGVGPVLIAARYLTTRPRRLKLAAAGVLLAMLIPYVVAIAACQFESRCFSSEDSAALARQAYLPPGAVLAAHVFRVIPYPVPLWEGFSSLSHGNAQDSAVYMRGQRFENGHPLYFVYALAVKIPVPIQFLLAGGLLLEAAALLRRKFQPLHLFWILPGFLYIGLASFSSFQLGVRLVLPALPLGLMICGTAVQWSLRGRRIALLAALFAVLALRTGEAYPHPMSFFNMWTGGPAEGLHYLADSNLDWGQNLRDLADLVHRRKIRKLHLSYFGSDAPWAYFRESELELVPPPWGPDLARGEQLKPEPGYWAISANLLPGHFFEPRYRNYYRAFREMEPIDRAGNSIYVYRVDAE